MIYYIDTSTPLPGEDNKPRAELFAADGQHLIAKWYEIWSSVVKEFIESNK